MVRLVQLVRSSMSLAYEDCWDKIGYQDYKWQLCNKTLYRTKKQWPPRRISVKICYTDKFTEVKDASAFVIFFK